MSRILNNIADALYYDYIYESGQRELARMRAAEATDQINASNIAIAKLLKPAPKLTDKRG